MTEIPPISDIQYYVFGCGVPIALAAQRLGTTPTRVMTELRRHPLPDWALPVARAMLGGDHAPNMSRLHFEGERARCA